MHHNLHFYKNLINLFSAPCGFCLLVYIFLCFDFTVSNFLKFSQEPVSFSPELWNTNNFELLQHPISEISPELFEAFWSHWFIPYPCNHMVNMVVPKTIIFENILLMNFTVGLLYWGIYLFYKSIQNC